jgi:hypothetical protein
MSQQISAVISPAWRFGHDNSNWLARSLRGHLLAMAL